MENTLHAEKDNRVEALKAAAKPLQDYLEANWHFYCTAVVSIDKIEIFESQIMMPTPENCLL